jgi:hypothetical protein
MHACMGARDRPNRRSRPFPNHRPPHTNHQPPQGCTSAWRTSSSRRSASACLGAPRWRSCRPRRRGFAPSPGPPCGASTSWKGAFPRWVATRGGHVRRGAGCLEKEKECVGAGCPAKEKRVCVGGVGKWGGVGRVGWGGRAAGCSCAGPATRGAPRPTNQPSDQPTPVPSRPPLPPFPTHTPSRPPPMLPAGLHTCSSRSWSTCSSPALPRRAH